MGCTDGRVGCTNGIAVGQCRSAYQALTTGGGEPGGVETGESGGVTCCIGMGAPEVRSAAMAVSCRSKARAKTVERARSMPGWTHLCQYPGNSNATHETPSPLRHSHARERETEEASRCAQRHVRPNFPIRVCWTGLDDINSQEVWAVALDPVGTNIYKAQGPAYLARSMPS